MGLVILLGLCTPLLAQAPGTAGETLVLAGSAVGVGLTVIGAAYGIGRLAGSALESMARQPEVAGSIQTAMIIAAALIEGFTFFALYICMTRGL
jgi:F-type H+-transporting ATPase subunit c